PEARRAAHRGPARPSRPCPDEAVLRRENGHRRDAQGPRGGDTRGGRRDRDERREPGARRPPPGRGRGRRGAPRDARTTRALVAPNATSSTFFGGAEKVSSA